MRAVGIKTLKNKLSEYVRLAAGGETILITDRDRVVAELTGPHVGRAEYPSDSLLADAVRKGWLTPPVGAAGPPPAAPPTGLSLEQVLAELRADRDSR